MAWKEPSKSTSGRFTNLDINWHACTRLYCLQILCFWEVPNSNLIKYSCLPHCRALRTTWAVEDMRQPWRRSKNHCQMCLTMEHLCPQRITPRILPQDAFLNIHGLPSQSRSMSPKFSASLFILEHRAPHFLRLHPVSSTHQGLCLFNKAHAALLTLAWQSHCWGGATLNSVASESWDSILCI